MRYYKATDGNITVFRATNREYGSAWFATKDVGGRYFPTGSFGFSKASPPAGKYPTVEIDKAGYDALVAAKVARIRENGSDPSRFTSPQDSWVRNVRVGGDN